MQTCTVDRRAVTHSVPATRNHFENLELAADSLEVEDFRGVNVAWD